MPPVIRTDRLTRLHGPHRGIIDVNLAVERLALAAYLGQPVGGTWDAGGVAGCLVLAIGGAALAARGMNRRDIAG